MEFPDDPNGDALRRMEAHGDDLTRPRDIEFTVVFPNQNAAKKFAEHCSMLGYAASIELTEAVADLPWDVVVIKHMVPSHNALGTFEDSLQRAALSLGGRNDGWVCLSQPVTPPSAPQG